MRKLCPNFDFEDGLDTVLEVPIPEEVFSSNKNSTWRTMKSWMKPEKSPPSMTALFGGKNAEIQLLLGVIGAPLIPFPVKNDHGYNISKNLKDQPIEASMAKYIVKQFVAAVGGETALNSIESMYAMGKVKMAASEFYSGEGPNNKVVKVRNMKYGGGEIGGFVLWQKRPELWCLELVVSGCKITAGSDGKVAWRQTPWHHSHASRGPPRPLRRLLQGIDPRTTANLFSDSICVGEKTIDNEDCFILKLEADHSTLKSRSSTNVDIIRHSIFGYFSQKTGLLMHLEDSNLIRIKSIGNDNIYWETTMETSIQDYKTVEEIKIAHTGKTWVSLFKFGENSDWNSRTRMEEVWDIEEVDFNIKGLSLDCFLPPSDVKKEEEGCDVLVSNPQFPVKIRAALPRISGNNKVAAVEFYDSDETDDEYEDEFL